MSRSTVIAAVLELEQLPDEDELMPLELLDELLDDGHCAEELELDEEEDELLDEYSNALEEDEELLELDIVAPFDFELRTAAPAGCRRRITVLMYT